MLFYDNFGKRSPSFNNTLAVGFRNKLWRKLVLYLAPTLKSVARLDNMHAFIRPAVLDQNLVYYYVRYYGNLQFIAVVEW